MVFAQAMGLQILGQGLGANVTVHEAGCAVAAAACKGDRVELLTLSMSRGPLRNTPIGLRCYLANVVYRGEHEW